MTTASDVLALVVTLVVIAVVIWVIVILVRKNQPILRSRSRRSERFSENGNNGNCRNKVLRLGEGKMDNLHKCLSNCRSSEDRKDDLDNCLANCKSTEDHE